MNYVGLTFTIDMMSPSFIQRKKKVHWNCESRPHAMCEIFDTSHRGIGQGNIHFTSTFGCFFEQMPHMCTLTDDREKSSKLISWMHIYTEQNASYICHLLHVFLSPDGLQLHLVVLSRNCLSIHIQTRGDSLCVANTSKLEIKAST